MVRFAMSLAVRAGPALVLGLAAALAPVAAWADAADDQYAVAAGLYARKQWKLAAEEFKVFLKDYPAHRQANTSRFLLAEAQLQLGQFDEARTNFLDYLAREPKGQFARSALFRSGEAAYRADKPQQAEGPLKRFLATYADDGFNAYALPYLGEIALAKRDYVAAEKCFRQGLAKFPQGALQDDCRFGLARALERQGHNEEALRLYLAVAGKPGTPLADDAQFRLGALQYALGRCGEAMETFGQFDTKFKESPNRPAARLNRGLAVFNLGRLDEAKSLFAGLASDPKVGIKARYWLGMVQREQKDWAAAAKTLLAIAQAHPKHPLISTIRFHAGDALLRAGDLAGAQKQFDEVIAAAEDNEWIDDALRGKVQAALEAHDHAQVDRAAADFLKRFAKSPLAPDVTALRGRSLLERKQFDQAATVLKPLVDGTQGAQALQNRYLLALAYQGLGQYDNALAQLAAVLKAGTGRLKADAQSVDASIRMKLGRFADAVAPLEALLATKPTGEEAIQAKAQLAVCYAWSKQLDKAKRLYADLVARHADHKLLAPTTEQVAEAAFAAGDWDWSAQLFTRLAAGGDDGASQVRGLSGLGWSQFRGGHLAEAAATFQQLLGKNPPEPVAAEAALVLGQVLQKQGEADPALAMYDRVIDKHPGSRQFPGALLAAARLCHQLKQDQRAAKLYGRLVEDYPKLLAQATPPGRPAGSPDPAAKGARPTGGDGLPDLDELLYEWAWSLFDLGRTDESRAVFERIHKDHPKCPFWSDATYRLAQSAFEAKDYARAGALVAELLAGQPKPQIREHALYLQGQAAAGQQKWDEVRAAFASLLADFPQSALRTVAEFWLAETHYRKKEYEAAGKQLDDLARRTQGQKESWMAMIALRRAQVLAHQKKWSEAYAIASKIAAGYPKFEQTYEVDYVLGRCLASRAEYDEARQAYKRVIGSPEGAKTETAAMAQWMIGESYFHQKNYEAALRAYTRVEILYAFPKWQAAALLQAAKCRELLGEWNEAVRLYGQLLEKYPNTPYTEDAKTRLEAAREHLAGAESPK